jgi:hypothetical protein
MTFGQTFVSREGMTVVSCVAPLSRADYAVTLEAAGRPAYSVVLRASRATSARSHSRRMKRSFLTRETGRYRRYPSTSATFKPGSCRT